MSSADRKNKLVFAVASDLHACSSNAESHLVVGSDESSATTHPIAGLKKLILADELRADALLCPGDLGNKADPTATQYAWNAIHEVAKHLKVSKPRVYATAGNHDVDSRYAHNGYDARGVLQSLIPRFPVANEAKSDRYWSRHFVLIESKDYRLLLLNSSAFHGTAEQEYEYGRVSERTVRSIRETLGKSQKKRVNILLCHHHPHPHADVGLGEHDLMKGGQDLLTLVGSGDFGQWIVVHGHKHHPKLSIAAGTSAGSPYVFAAGSLSAVLYPELATVARNQFYLVEFPLDEIETNGLVGTFQAWDWVVGRGWISAQEGSGLPASGGFGCRTQPDIVAQQVSDSLSAPSTLWASLRDQIPSLKYLLPPDVLQVEKILERDHSVRFLRNSSGAIERVEQVQVPEA